MKGGESVQSRTVQLSFRSRLPPKNEGLARKLLRCLILASLKERCRFCIQLFVAWFIGVWTYPQSLWASPRILCEGDFSIVWKLKWVWGQEGLLAEVFGNTNASFSSLSSGFSRVWTSLAEELQGSLISF